MKNFFLKKFFIGIITLVLVCLGLQFGAMQKICIEFFVKAFTPYNVSTLDLKPSRQFPFRANIQNLILVKNHERVASFKNILWKIPSLSFKDISLSVDECSVINKAPSFDFDFSNFSPSIIGYQLQSMTEKLKHFHSICIGHLHIDGKDLFLQLKSGGSFEKVMTLSSKGEKLKLILRHASNYSTLHLDGFWEGQQLLADAKINNNMIDLALKMNISPFANEHIVNFLGEKISLTAHLEKSTYWQLLPLKIETSNGHTLQGECAQQNNKLDGHFVWSTLLSDSTKLAKCQILVEGPSGHPTIKWVFKEGIEPLEVSGECAFIDSNNIKFFASLHHDEKNTASAKIRMSLSPFFINGKTTVTSSDLQKLLHPFLPNAKGSLNLEAFFEDVSSFERGHININSQGSISEKNFYVPINVKIAIHNGLGAGELHLIKGHYQQSPLDAQIFFNSTSEQFCIEKCKLQLQDLQFILLKPTAYHFKQGLSQAQIKFCKGNIAIEQLKFGHTLADITGIIRFYNIQLSGLNALLNGHDIAGVLNGQMQKFENKPLTIKLGVSKGFWRQQQDKHTYKILDNLKTDLEAEFENTAWKWNLKVKDQDKIDIKTHGEADLQNSTVDAYIKGLIRLKFLTDWLATDDRIFGDISIDLRTVGQLNSPVLKGSINLDNGIYEHSEVGTFYQNITIRTTAQGKRLLVSRFDAQDVTKSTEPDYGKLRGEGWIDFAEPFSPSFNILMHLFHLRIAQNDGFVSDASGTLAIVGKGAAVGCKGEVTLENVTYFIEQSIDSKIPKIIDRSLKKDKLKQEKSYATAFPLDILVHTPPGSFKVMGSGADTVWKGDFYVRKSIVNPFLVGAVYLHEGTLDILGKVLHITQGEIIFVDYDRNNPRLNIRAVRKLEDGVVVAIEIKGTGNNTIIDFTSIPSMPKEEVLALLLFGKKLGEVSVLQSVQLAELAKSDNDGRGFFEQMRSNFGFDQFEFKTTTRGGASPTDEDATPQERAEAKTSQAVRIGKEFGKVQVAIEQGAGSETSKLVVSTPLGKNLALQGDVGAAQNSGVGISWIKRY